MICRVCGSSDCNVFFDMGEMPLVNALPKAENAKENRYPLALARCSDCSMVQLEKSANPDEMFTDYTYFSGFSTSMDNHFNGLAQKVLETSLSQNPFVVEVGSNDGTLLRRFSQRGSRILGIDPAKNVAAIANSRGIPTWDRFFDVSAADEVLNQHGPADVLVGTNVLAHVPDIKGFTQATSRVLSDKGFAIFESPYLVDFLSGNEFDTVYHEHTFYLAVSPLSRLFREFGLDLFKVSRTRVHGGSLDYYVQKQGGPYERDGSVEKALELEKELGLNTSRPYDEFSERVGELRTSIRDTLLEISKVPGNRIAGYGAAAKGVVLLNYCDIGREIVPYLVDRNPVKQGRFVPGKGMPIHDPDHIIRDNPSHVLILPWNIGDEIMNKMEKYSKNGGKFILPLPKVRVL